MATIATPLTTKVVMMQNVGTTTTGAVKTANISLGTINNARYSQNNGDDKAIAIATAYGEIANDILYSVRRTNVYRLEEE